MTKFKAFAFLDRDGTINEEKEVHTVSNLELIPGAAQAIHLLNNANYCVVVVTNQPEVAKGFTSEAEVREVNLTLAKMLAAQGARIDAVYYCPHHPEKGHAGENPKYKIRCSCRKPGLKMLRKAEKKFGIKIDRNSFIVGDQTRDVQTGKNAGCKTVLVKTGFGGSDGKFAVEPDYVCKNLLDGVKTVLARKIGARLL